MSQNVDEATNNAVQEIGRTIIHLKKLLEDIVVMRVECAKLEFNMLSLYHTVCPEALEVLRDEQLKELNDEASGNAEDQNMAELKDKTT